MSRADYAHWNEEQDFVWWQEEIWGSTMTDAERPSQYEDDESWRDEPNWGED
jgi:hypothetical protein